jgi:hypothetical protein
MCPTFFLIRGFVINAPRFFGSGFAATFCQGDLGDKSDLGEEEHVTFVTYVTQVTFRRVSAEPLLQAEFL